MKTLIELYDERPIENVLASEVFRPERTVFLCPPDVAQSKAVQGKLKEYFRRKGLSTEVIFMESSMYNSEKLQKQMEGILEKYPDCTLDITGGTDAALFAGGMVSERSGLPTFTYSRRRGRFFNIRNAAFAEDVACEVAHTVEDCFLMAGGALRQGRVDNAILDGYSDLYAPFFGLYLKYRAQWSRIVGYIQRASQGEKGVISLSVRAPYIVKGERGMKYAAPENALRDFEKLNMISGLSVKDGQVSFQFRDTQIRTWLRDMGSVLELYIYKCCRDCGTFGDVRTSAVVDWEGDFRQDNVTNEIDVMAMQGIIPVFISCKTCAITTEALNELAILRDRFGGQMAKAAIVTSQQCRSITRNRASELDIEVIDLSDLKSGRTTERIRSLLT